MSLPPRPKIPHDTTEAAHRMQAAIYARMSPEQRVAIALELSEMTREACMAGIRSRHPGLSQREVILAFVSLVHGRALSVAMSQV